VLLGAAWLAVGRAVLLGAVELAVALLATGREGPALTMFTGLAAPGRDDTLLAIAA
jgi:hypothetical protein